jgi:NAD(P)-dependent dehydrogenase (short-subunit alcohol dehydrogenase family)
MELSNQSILIMNDRAEVGERIAHLAAALGARVTLVTPFPAGSAPAPALPGPSYRTVRLETGRPGALAAWLEGLEAPPDHLLIGHVARPDAAAGEKTGPPGGEGAYQWAYDFARRHHLHAGHSITLFSGPALVPAGGAFDATPAEVEDGCVRWLARALKPVRVNAVWAEPVRSPLPADPSVLDRQALNLFPPPHTRSRHAVAEDVAHALLHLLRTPALSGSVLRIDNTLRVAVE